MGELSSQTMKDIWQQKSHRRELFHELSGLFADDGTAARDLIQKAKRVRLTTENSNDAKVVDTEISEEVGQIVEFIVLQDELISSLTSQHLLIKKKIVRLLQS
mmetsp:Transcript_14870/g.31291  ORF Transcript_14870/g.31291 Transcript_14870/m.31291 type:complete len:103 (+) Transcript_14870:1131-1439(+)